MKHYEVIIVGGGPAGSSCARDLVRQNVKTLVIDRKKFPRLKICGGWVTPEAMERLELKPEDYPLRINRFTRMHIHQNRLNYSVAVEQYSISRIEFDEWLLNRSKAPVITENVTSIEEKGGRYVINDKYSCDYLVGAGGTACPVARRYFTRVDKEKRQIATRELEFDTEVLSPECHLFWPRKLSGYAWYVPKQNGRINIGVGGFRSKIDNIDRWWQFAEEQCFALGLIKEKLGKPKTHAYYINTRQKTGRVGNVFAIGDALGLATIDLAEGIGPAVESAQMVARAITSGEEYLPDKINKYSLPIGGLLRRLPFAPVLKS